MPILLNKLIPGFVHFRNYVNFVLTISLFDDIYFELNKHCVIVEIDEHPHNTYDDICECSRINEIVNGIGGKSVIIIRYNPDIIKNNGKNVIIQNSERIDLLVEKINDE